MTHWRDIEMQKVEEKKKGVKYFDLDTEEAILAFQEEPDIKKKKEIFVENVQPAFTKLIENVIFVYKFHSLGNVDILKNDCLSYLFEKLYRYKQDKGKAFSYFNVVAKNWFIQQVKSHKKKAKSDVQLDKALISRLEKNHDNILVGSHEDALLNDEFLELLKDEVKRWRDKFDKYQEKKVLEAVILLLQNPDSISIYNKKGIYLYIREITGLTTKQVATNLAKLKRKYGLFKKRYFAGEM